jgi:hypothetical protein
MAPSTNIGAVKPVVRRAARNVVIFQWPCGTLASRRSPLGARPRGGVMFILAQVSSINTSRSGFRSGCSRLNSSRLSATSGRSCSAAMSTFFDGQAKPLQRCIQRLDRQFSTEFRLELPQRQVGLLANQLTDPIGQRSPQQRSTPREARSNLVQLSRLLLDLTHP